MSWISRTARFAAAAALGVALLTTVASARVQPTDPGTGPGVQKAESSVPHVQATEVQNLSTLELFATIQDALDDVDTQNGHVLEVQTSPHSEGIVTVSKAVTIQGVGGSATLLATTDTGTSGDARGWFLVTVPGVTFKDLTFDGDGHVIWQAVRFLEGGTVTDCSFTDIKSLPTHYNGIGVATFKNATVTGCTFTDIGRIGIIFFGTDCTAGVASGNTFVGKGVGDHLDYGVELGGGAVATLSNNSISNCYGVASSDGSTSAAVIITTYFGAGTTGTVGNNFLTGNTGGIAAGFDGSDTSTTIAHDNDFSGNTDYGVQNTSTTTTVDASANWWGSNAAATVATAAGAGVDYTPWLDDGTDTNVADGFQGDFSTLDVDDDSPQVGAVTRIQEGINLVTASTVNVLPGTYPGNLILTSQVNLLGPQAGVDACGRVAAEAILTGTGTLLQLKAGSAGSVIDGFTFSGGTRGIESTSGPIDNVQILNNRFAGSTSSAVFLNDNGIDITVHQNEIDGSAQTGGGLFHLDQDNFDGFQFTDNCVVNGVNGTGLFVDGNHNVGASINRAPLLEGNLFDANETGANLGRFAFEYGTISNNTFSNSGYDGLQGGIQNTSITGNTFDSNGRYGLALTGFGGTSDPTRGAQNSTITNNDFTANTDAGLLFSSSQFAGTVSTNVAHQNNFVGNGTGGSGDGVAYSGTETLQVSCNWWGDIGGPDAAPSNPNPPADDLAATNAVFWPWLDAAQPGGTCNSFGGDTIAPVGGGCISTATPCVTVDVVFNRTDTTPMRGYSVTFQLSSELQLCSTPGASILQGPYLTSAAGVNGTVYQVVDNGSGSYTVDEAILGTPCGATGNGLLFQVQVTNSGGDGTGTITVTSVTLRDCANAPLPGIPGAPGSIDIDHVGPAAIADLAASQVKTGNDSDGTTKVQLTFTLPGDATAVEVYRAGFGNYPEYDDAPGAGSVPATPSYPPAGPWTLTAVTTSGGTDEVATRDFWYYVVFTKDACGNVSAVSNKTTGTLNYHLGDVHDGTTDCQGNNLVNTSDISFLGAHYAITLGPSDVLGCLDIGPTTDNSVDARPLTDNQIQFEDLILFAINFGEVSKTIDHPAPAAQDEILVLVPDADERGDTFEALVWARGTGRVQGLSAQLQWNAQRVEPLGVQAGDLLASQDGVVFASGPGGVDAALLGAREVGLSGEGVLARVRFRVVEQGDPGIGIASVDARDAANERIDLHAVAGGPDRELAVPRTTQLLPNVPNPFNPSTRLPFTLAQAGPVDLGVFTVDGRRVRTLARRTYEAGLHEVSWDGRDDGGTRVASGAYYVRLITGTTVHTRPVVLLK